MPITPAQRELRRKNLGGSDLPALLGVGPGQLYDVWLSKVHKTEDFTNPAMEWGNLFEGPVLTVAEQILGELRRDCHCPVDGSPIATNVDAIVEETGEPVEAKTTGITGPVYGDWGDEGTDEVPKSVIIQCHGHMLATKAEVCHVPTLIGGRGFVMYHVPRVQRLCDHIMALAEQFWTKHVLTREPPEGQWDAFAAPSLAILKQIKRVPGKLVAPDLKLVKRYETAKAAASWTEKIRDAMKAQLIASLGDAEGALLPDGRMVRYMEQTIKEHVRKASTFRKLDIVKTPQALLEAETDE